MLLDGGGLIDIDHLEGFVSGHVASFEPFPVHSPAGNIQVERTELTVVDDDGDGYADRGEGAFITSIGRLPITAQRTGLPAE